MRNTCNAHLSVTALTINRFDWKARHNTKEFFFLLLFVYDTFVCIACLALLKQIQYHFTNSSQTLPRYKRSELYAYSAWTTAFSKRKYNTPSPVTQKWKQLINCIVQIPPHILKQYGTQTQTGKHSFSI